MRQPGREQPDWDEGLVLLARTQLRKSTVRKICNNLPHLNWQHCKFCNASRRIGTEMWQPGRQPLTLRQRVD